MLSTQLPHQTSSLDSTKPDHLYLNDCHSQLNRTLAAKITQPKSLKQLVAVLTTARKLGLSVTPFGGKHAMGGQQFGTGSVALDTRGLNRVLGLDKSTGILEVEAGISWTQILGWLDRTRPDHGHLAGPHGWAIAQKQTGADELTIGGSLAANAHGRGLQKSPMIEDVESFTLLDPEARLLQCSRTKNADLFSAVIGGYGMFGLIYSVQLRLVPRRKLERIVTTIQTDTLMSSFAERIAAGFQFGDFQFQIDDKADDFLRHGIFSCYQDAPVNREIPNDQPALQSDDWLNLLHLAHTDKSKGFNLYQEHYLRTNQTLHWSDAHQFTTYVDGYHKEIDRRLKSKCPGSEMISELYVPRPLLRQFLELAREDLRRHGASVIYGTVRLIEEDSESFLNWAREPWACVILNLCVQHSPAGIARAKTAFRQLIDRAIELGGSYYLTYHRFARRDQVEAAYPQFPEFLKQKQEWDPRNQFQSDWFRHHQALFSND
jgi:FAD/FMN-containing dehydrogenase